MEANHNVSLIGKPGFRDRKHTPALGVDLDIMEQNMRGLREIAAAHNVHLRPHAKAHKSPQIAKMQIAHGADLTDILDQRDRDYCIGALRSRWRIFGADVWGAGGR